MSLKKKKNKKPLWKTSATMEETLESVSKVNGL